MNYLIIILSLLNISIIIVSIYFHSLNKIIFKKIVSISSGIDVKIDFDKIKSGDINQELLDNLRMKRDSISRICRNNQKIPLLALKKQFKEFYNYLELNPDEKDNSMLTEQKRRDLEKNNQGIVENENFLANSLEFLIRCNNQESKIIDYLSHAGHNIKYLKNSTQQMVVEAISCNYHNMGLINDLSLETKMACVDKNPDVIRYISEISSEMAEYAVLKKPTALNYVKNQTVELCLKALSADQNVYIYVNLVPNYNYEQTLENLKKRQLILNSLK